MNLGEIDVSTFLKNENDYITPRESEPEIEEIGPKYLGFEP
jgi:hypothetical protein